MSNLLICAGGVGVVTATAALWLQGRRRVDRRFFAGLVAAAVTLSLFSVVAWAATMIARAALCAAIVSRAAAPAPQRTSLGRPAHGPRPSPNVRVVAARLLPGRDWWAISGRQDADPISHRLCRSRRVRPRHPASALLCGAVWRLAATGDIAVGSLFADAAFHLTAVGKAQRPRRAAAGADRQHGCLGTRLFVDRQRDGAVDAVRRAWPCRRLCRQHRRGPGLHRGHHKTGGASQGDGPDRCGLRIGVHHRSCPRRAPGGQ